MGIDYSGGMIVGVYGRDIEVEDLQELIEDHDLEVFHPYYDAPLADSVVGFTVTSRVKIEQLDLFFSEVRIAAEELKELGIKDPLLIGMQDIS